jgi:hypothetical protein
MSASSNAPLAETQLQHTVCEIEHHDVVSSVIFADEFRYNGPQVWTKQGLKTVEEATESYMIELIAEASF